MLQLSWKEISVGYDVIGDIHGQAAKLEALLRKTGLRRASRRLGTARRAARRSSSAT